MKTERNYRKSLPRRADRWMVRGFTALLLLCLGAAAFGCGTTVEACYVHPQYGQVCVRYDGKLHVRADLTAGELAEVKAWLKDQGAEVEVGQ